MKRWKNCIKVPNPTLVQTDHMTPSPRAPPKNSIELCFFFSASLKGRTRLGLARGYWESGTNHRVGTGGHVVKGEGG